MKISKKFEALFIFYPIVHGFLILASAIWFFKTLEPLAFVSLIFFTYFMSPGFWFLLRLANGGTVEGAFYIGKRAKDGNLWFLYYQLQSIYSHFSFFERILKIFPGAYSAWLRLWGSKIGAAVNWTPECQIVDRGHLEIGARAFVGNRSYLSAHILKKRNDRYFLFVRGIRIGSDTMISYAANIGPGAVIGSRVHLDPGAEVYPNTRIEDGETCTYDRAVRT